MNTSAQVPGKTSVPFMVNAMTVKCGRLICNIEIPDEKARYMTEERAARACAAYPDLPQHACLNDEGALFGAVLDHTSMPHLVEHIAIDEQTQRSRNDDVVFTGSSEWVDEKRGLARIELSFTDDLEALRAFRTAVDFVNGELLR